jgi:RNA polymerase sigma-70 factor, ECF subfamily
VRSISTSAHTPGWDPAVWAGISDEEIIDRVRAGETALYEIVIRRYNQRLYRVARSILRNGADAEDVMQEAYVRAYQHLDQFAGEAKFATWLTKIAVHEALGRARHWGRNGNLEQISDVNSSSATNGGWDPERQAYNEELKLALTRAISALSESYRSVFVLRVVEDLNVADTAWCLGIGLEAVKSRLHRARAILRKELHGQFGIVAAQIYPLHLSCCDRVAEAVLRRIVAT